MKTTTFKGESKPYGRSGHFHEPTRHSLQAKGIKTGHPAMPLFVQNPCAYVRSGQEMYEWLWKRNKGIFYRGTAGGEGLGLGVLGIGLYVTWEEGMAKAFSRISAMEHGGTPKVEKYKLPKDLKLMDYQSEECWKIRQGMGVQSRWDKIGSPQFARLLTEEIKRKGYDGVISDDKADGIVIFDPGKAKLI